MTERNLKAILLDLDGTIADTAPDLAAALDSLLSEEGREPLDFETVRPFVSYGSPKLVRLGFGEALSETEFARLKKRFLELYRANICDRSRLFPGIAELFETIEAAGLAWGVVTNKPGWLTMPLMEELQLHERAGSIVSGDTLEHSKPHPAPLFHAAREMKVEAAECIYVGDAQRDIEAGLAAGMFTIAVSWGYVPDDEDIHDWDAHRVLHKPHEILEYVPQQRTGM
ncbi:MAG: HAD-IA family hydrolase [Gammaproteobacteria bacterium]